MIQNNAHQDSDVLSVEEYLSNEDKLGSQSVQMTFDDEDDEEFEQQILPKQKKAPKEKKERYVLPTTSVALTKNARTKLELYLKRSPQFKVLQSQIDILLSEMKNYKLIGDKENAQKCEFLINELGKKKSDFVKLYKNTNNNPKVRLENEEKIKSSEKIKELKAERKDLEIEFQMKNPNSLVAKMKSYREALSILDPDKEDIFDVENDPNAEMDLDEFLDSGINTMSQEYQNLCGHIANMINENPSIVNEMKLSDIKKELQKVVSQAELEKIKNALFANKIQTSSEMSSLKGNDDITNIMFEIFDFETTPEEQPKEMLAASNINYVKSIAYNNCSKLNMLYLLDDAIAYGLMGLTDAINKWYSIQKLKDSAITFSGFSHTYISMAIKRGMYELTSGGRISGSSMATLIHYREKTIKNYVQNNPEFKDLPKEMLESLLDDVLDEIPRTVTEGSYTDTVGGEDGDSGDIWANAASSDMVDDKFIEAKLEYEVILKSIKQFFNLFQTKTDNETGIRKITDKKIFNKYDYKLFKLTYDIEFKRDEITGQKTKYTQDEIRFILADMYAANGDTTKTFEQGAISERIKVLNKKIKGVLEQYPELKPGFEYMYGYMAANRETMSILSNNREEHNIKIERDELREVYEDDEDELNKRLSDGTRLSDVFDVTQNNLLDDEIAEAFMDYEV